MLKIITFFAMALSMAAGLWAQTPPPAEEKIVTPYGVAQYHFREEIITNLDAAGAEQGAMNFSNRLGYKFGTKIKVNSQVNMQFEIGDDWYSTNQVNDSLDSRVGLRDLVSPPYFSLAMAKWDPGCLAITAGIQPLMGAAVMDLLSASLYPSPFGVPRTYKGAALIPWGVLTNFSRPGLKIGAPVLKGGCKLGVNLFSTVLSERAVKPAVDSLYKNNHGALMLLLETPLSIKGLTVTPQLVVNLNRNYRDDAVITEGADHEIIGGFDAGYKLNDMISLRTGVGFGKLSDANTFVAGDSVVSTPAAMNAVTGVITPAVKKAVALYSEKGLFATLGVTAKAGPGAAMVDLNYSTDDNTEVTDSKVAYVFADIKYAWNANKNFTLMPRVRAFYSNPVVDGSRGLRYWPELIFIGSF